MTTKITITHDGPDHRNVKVVRTYGAKAPASEMRVLKTGQTYETHVYDDVKVEVTETDEAPTAE